MKSEIMIENIQQTLQNLQAQINQLNQLVTQQDQLIQQLTQQNNYSYDESDPHYGIISAIHNPIRITGGGKMSYLFPINNLTDYSNSIYVNYYDMEGKPHYNSNRSIEQSWIQFDFGIRKINLESYLIRSNSSGLGESYHPKSWTILGSNDENQWAILDRRVSDLNLNGSLNQCHFICPNLNQNEKYRYIKYVQDDTWSLRSEAYNPFNIALSYFELFGNVSFE